MRGFCAFDGRGLVWLFVLVFCCCFSTTIIIYFYTINDKYITREGFTEHILPGDEGVRDFFPVMFFVLGVSLFALRSSLRCFRDAVFVFLSGFFCFFESVRLWCSSCCGFFRVHSVFSAFGRCVLCGSLLCAAGRVCVCPSFGSRLPCPRESGVASVPQRLCSVVSVRTYLGRVQMVLRPTGAVPGVCGSGPRGCADGSCLIVDSMVVVIYESAPVVVAGCDQVLFRMIKLPVAEGLFQKQVRLHPKIIVFKIQCIIKFAIIVIYDHLMRQSGLKYRTLGWYRLHTGILLSFDAAVFVFSSALLPAQTFADLRFS